MKFLTIALLSVSLAAGAEAAKKQQSEPVSKVKVSRGKSILRAVGSFGAGVLMSDPYQDVSPKKQAAESRARKH
jgi:hypothetical protein